MLSAGFFVKGVIVGLGLIGAFGVAALISGVTYSG